MANCKVETKEVSVTTYVEQKVVTLELTHEEAMVLSLVLAGVGGDPVISQRRYVQNIISALDKNNYSYIIVEDKLKAGWHEILEGTINFLEQSYMDSKV